MIIEDVKLKGFWLNLDGEEKQAKANATRWQYADDLHGFRAIAVNRTAAWLAIRDRCRRLRLEVPTFDKIKLISNE